MEFTNEVREHRDMETQELDTTQQSTLGSGPPQFHLRRHCQDGLLQYKGRDGPNYLQLMESCLQYFGVLTHQGLPRDCGCSPREVD